MVSDNMDCTNEHQFNYNFRFYLFFNILKRYITLDTREDSPLLDGRGLLKTISINSPEQSLTQVHVIKAVHDLMPVTLQLRGKVIKMNI